MVQHFQVASFSFADLWSSIGGILGLWVGFSVITIIEIMSFVMTSIYSYFYSFFKEKKVAILQNAAVSARNKRRERSASMPATIYSKNGSQDIYSESHILEMPPIPELAWY